METCGLALLRVRDIHLSLMRDFICFTFSLCSSLWFICHWHDQDKQLLGQCCLYYSNKSDGLCKQLVWLSFSSMDPFDISTMINKIISRKVFFIFSIKNVLHYILCFIMLALNYKKNIVNTAVVTERVTVNLATL